MVMYLMVTHNNNNNLKSHFMKARAQHIFVAQNHLFLLHVFFPCSIIHNLLFIAVFCNTNGLRIKTNQEFPCYQGGNRFLNNFCLPRKLAQE